MKRACILFITVLFQIGTNAQNIRKELIPFSDSLCRDLKEHFDCEGFLKLKKASINRNRIDFHFGRSLADYPFRESDMKWLKSAIGQRLPEQYSSYGVGQIYSDNIKIEDYLQTFRAKDPKTTFRFIEERGKRNYKKGLDRRYIALWQSHGKYFSDEESRWKWQRANLHTTVEDIYTQSYVLPFLIPMLENAGAYVVTPRERDINTFETIADNDPSFVAGRELPGIRTSGRYYERGKWSDCGPGFADTVAQYSGDINPFSAGSARKSICSGNGNASAEAVWEFDFPGRGHFAVYISYKSLENSTSCAHYCVNHAGGKSEFMVNQRMGGSTWIYLGSFDFDGKAVVTLDNSISGERNFFNGQVVTADAVRIGGGMGKTEREGMTSGVPAYLEGAMYNLQWCGFPKSVWGNEMTEYINEFSCRPYWVKALKNDYGIPIDAALAIHSDGGETYTDKTVGTLAIYSLTGEDSREFSSGLSRMTNRELGMKVQDEIIDAIRRNWNPDWTRRGLRNRNYREASRGDVPTVILELLSHQNLDDMKYGLDPEFRFDVCRAIYKGVLKYLASLYNCQYVVQPLPVRNFSALWTEKDAIRLSWEPTPDPTEPTAAPDGYILYTRKDDGHFDRGMEIRSTGAVVNIEPGHVYSFRIEAWNEGGKSFPSETLAAGIPVEENGEGVIVVNNFTRTSGPTWFEDGSYAGFDVNKDRGVPYLYDISYAGEVFDFNRESKWKSNDIPGFGGSYSDFEASIIAGNSFDYVATHGAALLELGRRFCSSSVSAFTGREAGILDLICGNQLSSLPRKRDSVRHRVFSPHLMEALDRFMSEGGNVIISGSRIATDAVSEIYPGASGKNISSFVAGHLGYELASSVAGRDGKVGDYEYFCSPNAECYCVENADAIKPAGTGSVVLLRYARNRLPAVVLYNPGTYKAVSFGFPIETLKKPEWIKEALGMALREF